MSTGVVDSLGLFVDVAADVVILQRSNRPRLIPHKRQNGVCRCEQLDRSEANMSAGESVPVIQVVPAPAPARGRENRVLSVSSSPPYVDASGALSPGRIYVGAGPAWVAITSSEWHLCKCAAAVLVLASGIAASAWML